MLGNLWMLSLFLCVSCAEAHIWAWMLNMPHSPPKEGTKALRENLPVAKPVTVSYSIQYINTIQYKTVASVLNPKCRYVRKLQDFHLGQV